MEFGIRLVRFDCELKDIKLTFKNNFPDKEIYHMGDYKRIHQILVNYMSNSAKFTNAGSIDVTLSLLSDTDCDSVGFAAK